MDKLTFNSEDVVLVNLIREGSDASAEVYAVPVEWADSNNIKQYDWEDATSIPSTVYDELLDFPKINITRVWDI
ncbi:hypothetical protein [Evansella clarkii]|uniref:hypothetical protein n=1 Tax=Evansella clarkii TaxID=79879 RepID=UPI00099682BA|nr:hypothetical protein [Evansella clarkii]